MVDPELSESAFNLRRSEAAEFLTANGFPTAARTLAKLASIGGGPEFVSYGRWPMYARDRLLSWARSRTTGPRRSTSDHAAPPAAA